MKFRFPNNVICDISLKGDESIVKVKRMIKDKFGCSEKDLHFIHNYQLIEDNILIYHLSMDSDAEVIVTRNLVSEVDEKLVLNVKRRGTNVDQWIMVNRDVDNADLREAILNVVETQRNFEIIDQNEELFQHGDTVATRGITDEAVLTMIDNGESGTLHVKDILDRNERFSITYQSLEKVIDIKNKVKAKLRYSATGNSQIALIYNNLCLIDEKSLIVYGIRDDTILSVVDLWGSDHLGKLEFVGKGRCACKIFKKRDQNGQVTMLYRYKLDGEFQRIEDYKPIVDEIIAVKQVGEHEHIVQLRALYQQTLSTKNYFFVGFEAFKNGNLEDLIKMHGLLNEEKVRLYIPQVLKALREIHQYKVIHRDIRCCNIFLCDDNKTVKLANFTLAKYMEGCGSINRCKTVTFQVGSRHWMAPEIINDVKLSAKSDIWSLGVTIFEMLTGKPPYGDLPELTAIVKIGKFKPLEHNYNPPLSPFLREVIEQCFQTDPDRRPTANGLLDKFNA